MVSREEVESAFKTILGREPGAEKTIQNFMQCTDFMHLRKLLLSSQEFATKYRMLKQEYAVSNILKEDIEAEKIVFLHIPKTGGTTFHEILTSLYPPALICPERFNSLGTYTSSKLAGFRLFSGHFDYLSTCLIPGSDIKVISFFRKPVDRLLSMYQFFRSHRLEFAYQHSLNMAILANKFSFHDFFTCPDIFETYAVFNCYVFTLTGEKPSGQYTVEEGSVKLNSQDTELLEQAKKILDSLFAFGILEHYDQSVRLIMKKLQLPDVKKIEKKMVLSDLVKTSSHKKVTPVKITEKEERIIESNTYLDNFLYQYAVDKFNRMCSES